MEDFGEQEAKRELRASVPQMASTASSIKLSAPQQKLLTEIIARPQYVAEYYGPAVVLVREGLAEWTENHFSTLLRATEKGRLIAA